MALLEQGKLNFLLTDLLPRFGSDASGPDRT
jgi:hypothetical protein